MINAGAQPPEQRTALHHGKGHGVENEKHPDQQGEQAHGGQIQLEGRRQAGHTLRLLGHRQQLHSGRDALPDPLLSGGVQYQVDVAESAAQTQNGLGGCDIDQQQILAGAAGLRIDTQHAQCLRPSLVNNVQRIACSDSQRPGRSLAEHQRVGLRQPVAQETRPVRKTGELTAKRCFGKQVKTDQPVTPLATGDPDPVARHRCHWRCAGFALQADIDIVRERSAGYDKSVGGFTLQLLCRQLEGCARAAVGQLHRQHHRHAQGDAGQGQQRLPAMARQIAQPGAQQQG
jgi:hypothetical protein